jgi:predicted acylesterase/phospholipase RssA
MDAINQHTNHSKRAVHLVLDSGGVKTFSYIGALQELVNP